MIMVIWRPLPNGYQTWLPLFDMDWKSSSFLNGNQK
jgi:hypothetical protein